VRYIPLRCINAPYGFFGALHSAALH